MKESHENARAVAAAQGDERSRRVSLFGLYVGGWALVALASAYSGNLRPVDGGVPVFPFPMPAIPLISPEAPSVSLFSFLILAFGLALMVVLSVLIRRGGQTARLSLGATFVGCFSMAFALARLDGTGSATPGSALLQMIVVGAKLFLIFVIPAVFLAALRLWAATSAAKDR